MLNIGPCHHSMLSEGNAEASSIGDIWSALPEEVSWKAHVCEDHATDACVTVQLHVRLFGLQVQSHGKQVSTLKQLGSREVGILRLWPAVRRIWS